jgi:cytochrome P450
MAVAIAKSKRIAPGPKPLNPFENTRAFRRDPVGFLSGLARDYGDLVQFNLLNQPVLLVNHPDYVRQVFQINYLNYDKYAPLWEALKLLGNGLGAIQDEDAWRRQRRLTQSVFHKRSIVVFLNLMQAETQTMLEGWEVQRAKGEPVNLNRDLSTLGEQILRKTIFYDGLGGHAQGLNDAFGMAGQFLNDYVKFPFPPLSVPTPRHRRFRAALEKIDEIVYRIIRQRRQDGQQEDDLLSMLLSAVDAETGEGMSDQQIRDELVTFLVGGSNSTSITLTFALMLLAQNPDQQERLHTELSEVLRGEPPTIEALYQLSYTRQCIDETLRIYPVGWMTMRHAVKSDQMGDYQVKAGTLMYVSPYLLHRHPAIWEEPERFDPDRFTPERQAQIPRGAYIPFITGPHICVGQHFAMQQMLLVLARVIQNYRVELAPRCEITLGAHISLYMKEDMLVYLHPR